MQKVSIGPYDGGQRLDKYLQRFLKEAEKGFLYKMLRKKNITLNGKKAEGSEIVKTGDEICFYFSDETFAAFRGTANAPAAKAPAGKESLPVQKNAAQQQPDAGLIRPIYEDEQVIAVFKPAGMLSQKAEAGDVSLVEHLKAYLSSSAGARSEGFVPSVANRLDRNTSGLVLAGKTLPGQQLLTAWMRDRSLRKYYYALVIGQCESAFRSVLYWQKDEAQNKAVLTKEPGEGRDRVEIEVEPVMALKRGCSLFKIRLITGKSHQIRAQLAFLGYPVLGDKKYGNLKENRAFSERYGYPLRHQLLHAAEIVFPEKPASGLSSAAISEAEKLAGRTIKAPLPQHFSRCLSDLGGDGFAF